MGAGASEPSEPATRERGKNRARRVLERVWARPAFAGGARCAKGRSRGPDDFRACCARLLLHLRGRILYGEAVRSAGADRPLAREPRPARFGAARRSHALQRISARDLGGLCRPGVRPSRGRRDRPLRSPLYRPDRRERAHLPGRVAGARGLHAFLHGRGLDVGHQRGGAAPPPDRRPFATMRHPLFVAVALARSASSWRSRACSRSWRCSSGSPSCASRPMSRTAPSLVRFGADWRDYADRVPAFAVPGPFRRRARAEPRTVPFMTTIRSEIPDDTATIGTITTDAFALAPHKSGAEAAIVDALRRAGALTLSLVAEEDGAVVGHVAFSPVTVDGRDVGCSRSAPSPCGRTGRAGASARRWCARGPPACATRARAASCWSASRLLRPLRLRPGRRARDARRAAGIRARPALEGPAPVGELGHHAAFGATGA